MTHHVLLSIQGMKVRSCGSDSININKAGEERERFYPNARRCARTVRIIKVFDIFRDM